MSKKKSEAKSAAGFEVPAPQMVQVGDLHPAPYNPRVMPPAMMSALKASLRQTGMVVNLVVQRKSAEHGAMVVIGGHQRLEAMRQICEEDGTEFGGQEVPAVVLDVDDARAKALNVSLNRVEGSFDDARLAELLSGIELDTQALLATGFTGDELAALLASKQPLDLSTEADALEAEGAALLASVGAGGASLVVEFEKATDRDLARDAIKAAAKERGKKAGDVLLQALRSADMIGKPKSKTKKPR